MTKRYHLSLCLEGALRQRKKITYCMHDDGRKMTDKEARAEFRRYISEGKRVIPIGDECDSFDYIHGCPGHEINE